MKSIRNKALRNIDRLMVADYRGQSWDCPGGYFATSKPIYEGYRTKKSQIVYDYGNQPKPNLGYVVDNQGDQSIKVDHRAVDDMYTEVTAPGLDYTIRFYSDYFNLLLALHPNATLYVSSGNNMSPVFFKEADKLVAIIMPVKS